MVLLSTEFWIVFQISLLLFLGLFFWFYYKNSGEQRLEQNDTVAESTEKIMTLLEPLLKEAESSATVFESQILEKKRIIQSLNDKLDNRIINLTLLLNRADAVISNAPDMNERYDLADTQEAIISLYNEGTRASEISRQLSVSEQEVDLVIGLKKKFLAMEQTSDSVVPD